MFCPGSNLWWVHKPGNRQARVKANAVGVGGPQQLQEAVPHLQCECDMVAVGRNALLVEWLWQRDGGERIHTRTCPRYCNLLRCPPSSPRWPRCELLEEGGQQGEPGVGPCCKMAPTMWNSHRSNRTPGCPADATTLGLCVPRRRLALPTCADSWLHPCGTAQGGMSNSLPTHAPSAPMWCRRGARHPGTGERSESRMSCEGHLRQWPYEMSIVVDEHNESENRTTQNGNE